MWITPQRSCWKRFSVFNRHSPKWKVLFIQKVKLSTLTFVIVRFQAPVTMMEKTQFTGGAVHSCQQKWGQNLGFLTQVELGWGRGWGAWDTAVRGCRPLSLICLALARGGHSHRITSLGNSKWEHLHIWILLFSLPLIPHLFFLQKSLKKNTSFLFPAHFKRWPKEQRLGQSLEGKIKWEKITGLPEGHTSLDDLSKEYSLL